MTDIVLGVYNQIPNRSESYQRRVQGISEFGFDLLTSTGDTRISKIIRSISVDDILAQASAIGTKWLVITALGHRILSSDLAETMIGFAKEKSAAVVGHILDDCPGTPNQQFFSLHHQCVLIDMDQWRGMGRPAWGNYGIYRNQLLPMCERSPDNFHDDYTPLFLLPTPGHRFYTGLLKEGWNLISSCLVAGLPVWNFDLASRKRKAHLYPEVGELENYFTDPTVSVLQPSQRQYVETMQAVKRAVFVFNNEFSNKNLVGQRKLNNLFCVAAGFKPMEFLQQRSFDNHTQVHYFDHSESALDFRQWLVAHWDGVDYLWALDTYKKLNPDFETNWLAFKDYRPQWEIIIDKFGGQDSWLDLWKKYQALTHHYHLVDLFESDHRQQLISHVSTQTKDQHSVVWFSNAFCSDYSRFKCDTQQLSVDYSNFITQLSQVQGSIEIFGQNPTGKWEELYHANSTST